VHQQLHVAAPVAKRMKADILILNSPIMLAPDPSADSGKLLELVHVETNRLPQTFAQIRDKRPKLDMDSSRSRSAFQTLPEIAALEFE
jgi:hypothetical protein